VKGIAKGQNKMEGKKKMLIKENSKKTKGGGENGTKNGKAPPSWPHDDLNVLHEIFITKQV
jgi:hypothetical protein